jgi:hypothetical protein
MLVEHQSVPWNALPGQMVEIGGGEFLFGWVCGWFWGFVC